MLTAEDILRIGEGVAESNNTTAKEVHLNQKVVPIQVFDEDESFDVPEAYISPDLKSMIDVAQTEINKIKAIGMTQYLKTKSDAKTKSVIKIQYLSVCVIENLGEILGFFSKNTPISQQKTESQ